MTTATGSPGAWVVTAPCPVGPVDTLLARLADRRQPSVLGVDFPLGLPRGYAALHAAEADFPSFLRGLAMRPEFFDVCQHLDAVCAARPFYPARGTAGMTRLSHAQALGLAGAAALSRCCDRATNERPAGAPVFWTLGANQSGKAAIAAWRDLLLPALGTKTPPRLWPFEGPFRGLLRPGQIAIAETYPAEAMRHLGLKQSGSKRRQADRAAHASFILHAIRRLSATATPSLKSAITDGFGATATGEDQFDSVLGVLCVIGVLENRRPDTAPNDPHIQKWEGWVLGQTALPKSAGGAGPVSPNPASF